MAAGDDTLYQQQRSQYIREYNDNNIKSEEKEAYTDPKGRFIKDLRTILQKATIRQSDIILTGDFNDEIGDGNNKLTLLLSEFDLTDAHAHKHGYNTKLTSYKRGQRRIDYFLVNHRLLDHVIQCGFEQFDAQITSDHRGYFVDFLIPGIFDRRLPQLFSKAVRSIKGNHPSNITKYIEYLHKYITEHNIIRQAMEMMHVCYFDMVKVEILYSQITEGMLAAEKECLITYQLPWDEITHDLMTRVNILKIVLSGLKTGIDNKDVINNKMNTLKEPIDLPTTTNDTNKELRELTRRQRQLIRDKQSYNTRIYQEQEKSWIEAYKNTMSEKRAKAIFKGKEEMNKL